MSILLCEVFNKKCTFIRKLERIYLVTPFWFQPTESFSDILRRQNKSTTLKPQTNINEHNHIAHLHKDTNAEIDSSWIIIKKVNSLPNDFTKC